MIARSTTVNPITTTDHLFPRSFALLGFSAVPSAAARALSGQEDLSAEEVARKSMEVRCLRTSVVADVGGVTVGHPGATLLLFHATGFSDSCCVKR